MVDRRTTIKNLNQPWWLQPIQTATAPLRWAESNVVKPFAANALAPFIPVTSQNRNQTPVQRYENWQEPTWMTLPNGYKVQPTKGIIENLPWLAVPSAGMVAGKLGQAAKVGGELGKIAELGQTALKPAVALENLPGKLVGKALGSVAPKQIASEVSKLVTHPDSTVLTAFDPAGKVLPLADNLARNKALETDLLNMGYKPLSVNGMFEGKPSPSFMVQMPEKDALALADKYGQTSIWKNKGIVYTKDGSYNPATGLKFDNTLTDNYTEIGGQRFQSNINFNLTASSREQFVVKLKNLNPSVTVTLSDTFPWKESNFHTERGFKLLTVGMRGLSENDGRLVALHETAHNLLKHTGIVYDPKLEAEAWKWAEYAAPSYGIDASNIDQLIGKTAESKSTLSTFKELKKLDVQGDKELGKPAQLAASQYQVPTPDNPAIQKLIQLVRAGKPLRKGTEQLYRIEKNQRAIEAQALIDSARAAGKSAPEAMKDALQALAGKYPQSDLSETFTQALNALTPEDMTSFSDMIYRATANDAFKFINTSTAFQNLMLEKIPTRAEMKLLEKVFGSQLIAELLNKRSFWTKAGEFAIDLANAPRALLASADISGLLRQGGVLVGRNPVEGINSVEPMLKAMFSDQNEALIDTLIRSRPHSAIAEQYGLYFAPKVGTLSVTLAEHEEAFMSNLINKIPFVKGSNRAYVTGLNDLRSRVWEKTINQWEKKGVSIVDQDYQDLAQFINWATGRGTLPGDLNRHGSLLNAVFFSPKLMFSRVELPASVLPSVTKSALVRAEAWKTVLTDLGVGTSLLGAAVLSNQGTVELDPRSSDFGKLKIGNTRLDIWTGYAQYMRLLAQLATSERKTQGGTVIPANRADLVGRFAQSKSSPAVGFIHDLLAGETYQGTELPSLTDTKGVIGQLYQRMMPLAVQDLITAIQQDGVDAGILATSGFLGVGVVTYTDKVKKAEDKAAQENFGMTWDELGLKQGKAAQLVLQQKTPAIIEAQKEQEKQFGASNPTVMTRFFDEGKTIEDTYRKAITLAAKEFDSTGDGKTFKSKVDSANDYRRMAYGARAIKSEFQTIISSYQKPVSPEQVAQMNLGDVARLDYYQQLFGADMYDQYGNYRFDVAEQKEADFINKYGQSAKDYIDLYNNSRWADKPAAMIALDQAKQILEPYWQITDQVWSMYDPQLRIISDQIQLMERGTKQDQEQARGTLSKYPQILRARALIAQQKRIMKLQNPLIDQMYRTFYGQ